MRLIIILLAAIIALFSSCSYKEVRAKVIYQSKYDHKWKTYPDVHVIYVDEEVEIGDTIFNGYTHFVIVR